MDVATVFALVPVPRLGPRDAFITGRVPEGIKAADQNQNLSRAGCFVATGLLAFKGMILIELDECGFDALAGVSCMEHFSKFDFSRLVGAGDEYGSCFHKF